MSLHLGSISPRWHTTELNSYSAFHNPGKRNDDFRAPWFFQETFMRRACIGLSFILVLCASLFGQDRGVIQCDTGSTAPVPAWTAPGSAYVVEQLSCGQMVSIVGLERGYVRIQIGERFGFVDSKYVRVSQTQSEQDRRIADLEAQVKFLRQQASTPAPATEKVTPPPAPSKAETISHPEPPRAAETQRTHSYELQEYPKFEIFGGYTFVRLDGGMGNMDGWNASFLGNFNSIVGLKGEVSGLYAKNTVYSSIRYSGYSVMGGPQITGRSGPASVFAHALFGVEHIGVGVPFEGIRVGASLNAFAMALGGGVDWHRGRWGIRLPQVDYFPWRALGGTAHNVRISGGIVFRLD